jgi:ERCC4-type nuclease
MLDLYRYSKAEMDELVKSMVILVDTREKVNDHILKMFEKNNIAYKIRKLDYGDYSVMIPKNDKLNIPRDLMFSRKIMIERKGSLEEISGNLTNDRDRLEKELTLAPKTKVILVENGSYEDLCEHRYDTQYGRSAFVASLHSFWFRYNCPIFFMPNPRYSGVFIAKYLEYYIREFFK